MKSIEENIPYYVIGNGSNLLVQDDGFDGVIIEIDSALAKIEINGNEIVAKAGAKLSKIAVKALNESLTGFEFAHGIPGNLGGAVTMNAGAYGGEMKDVLKWVKVLDNNGEMKTLKAEELELGYRTSIIVKERGNENEKERKKNATNITSNFSYSNSNICSKQKFKERKQLKWK